jgi:hypothetical protein
VVGRMDIRGLYRFSSLVKQNKKAKICFVIHIAGEKKILFSIYFVIGKQKKNYALNSTSCNTMSTEGEKETSWRHKEHDNSIITRAFKFFITKGSTQWVIFATISPTLHVVLG